MKEFAILLSPRLGLTSCYCRRGKKHPILWVTQNVSTCLKLTNFRLLCHGTHGGSLKDSRDPDFDYKQINCYKEKTGKHFKKLFLPGYLLQNIPPKFYSF